jgi:hypothetical protein
MDHGPHFAMACDTVSFHSKVFISKMGKSRKGDFFNALQEQIIERTTFLY